MCFWLVHSFALSDAPSLPPSAPGGPGSRPRHAHCHSHRLSHAHDHAQHCTLSFCPEHPSLSRPLSLSLSALTTGHHQAALSLAPSNPAGSREHGEGAAHDPLGHPEGLNHRGQPAGQAENAGALRQFLPHSHLPTAHVHHRLVNVRGRSFAQQATQWGDELCGKAGGSGSWASGPFVKNACRCD